MEREDFWNSATSSSFSKVPAYCLTVNSKNFIFSQNVNKQTVFLCVSAPTFLPLSFLRQQIDLDISKDSPIQGSIKKKNINIFQTILFP